MKAKDLATKLMQDPEAEVFILDDSRSLALPVGNVASIEEVEAENDITCVGGGDISAIILVSDPNADTSIQFDEEGSEVGDDDEDFDG